MAVDTYYFNANRGIDDLYNAWVDDTNAFDGDLNTYAYTDEDILEIYGFGTNAPSESSTITQVRFRFKMENTGGSGGVTSSAVVYENVTFATLGLVTVSGNDTGAVWSDYVVLDEPLGGWSWGILVDFAEVLFIQETTGTVGQFRVYGTEIEVTHSGFAPTTSSNGTIMHHMQIAGGII
jgi:hypothetical protein